MTTDAYLKSCPFCGGAAAIEQRDYGWGYFEYRAYCSNVLCDASTIECKKERDARAAWNKRAVPASEPTGIGCFLLPLPPAGDAR